ncbi:unnamed protein product [Ambrosiozyma monospora]|uniref:Unnamed protein product n=1 Tax=Ambrosiozyma monospora TaxID=43982 RepID=A0ACB5SYY8_AMBMO|nr:unnamed protein product [Ambrosiozyma monospora]
MRNISETLSGKIVSAYIVTSGSRSIDPELKELVEDDTTIFPNSPSEDEAIAENVKKETVYTRKIVRLLRDCSAGQKEFCLIIEDDAVLVHDIDYSKKLLASSILSRYGNYEEIYDCGKTGWWPLSKEVRGNNLMCRVIPNMHSTELANLLEASDLPADLALKEAAISIGLRERRFKLVEHTGYKTTIHESSPRYEDNPAV